MNCYNDEQYEPPMFEEFDEDEVYDLEDPFYEHYEPDEESEAELAGMLPFEDHFELDFDFDRFADDIYGSDIYPDCQIYDDVGLADCDILSGPPDAGSFDPGW